MTCHSWEFDSFLGRKKSDWEDYPAHIREASRRRVFVFVF